MTELELKATESAVGPPRTCHQYPLQQVAVPICRRTTLSDSHRCAFHLGSHFSHCAHSFLQNHMGDGKWDLFPGKPSTMSLVASSSLLFFSLCTLPRRKSQCAQTNFAYSHDPGNALIGQLFSLPVVSCSSTQVSWGHLPKQLLPPKSDLGILKELIVRW